jgi:hypothetical protein
MPQAMAPDEQAIKGMGPIFQPPLLASRASLSPISAPSSSTFSAAVVAAASLSR